MSILKFLQHRTPVYSWITQVMAFPSRGHWTCLIFFLISLSQFVPVLRHQELAVILSHLLHNPDNCKLCTRWLRRMMPSRTSLSALLAELSSVKNWCILLAISGHFSEFWCNIGMCNSYSHCGALRTVNH